MRFMKSGIGRGRRVRVIGAAFAFYAGLGAMSDRAAAQEWKPEKPVELVATNAPGGGSDRILRIMVKILQDRRMLPVPVSVVNRPGGGGSVAYNYVNQRAGDGHAMVLGSRSILTNHIAGHGPSYTELTPVVWLFDEYISVTVKPISPIKTGRDLISFMKRDPSAISFGIATSIGGPNHQGIAVPLRVSGIDIKKIKNVIFPSGGAASTAMMGGHVDVVPISVAFGASLLRNKQVRMIAVTAPKRFSGVLADVPTWREQGVNAEVATWRVLVGPKGMTPGQIAYWENLFRRFIEAEEWKKELEENFWTSHYMGSAETRKRMAIDNEESKAFLAELGLAR
jgi:putative tricarboxylic transport membrane protein